MQVPDSIGQLICLTALVLLDCPLKELSSRISCLQNLRHLNVETTHFLEVSSCHVIFYCTLHMLA